MNFLTNTIHSLNSLILHFNRLFLVLFILVYSTALGFDNKVDPIKTDFSYLINRLIEDGIEPSQVDKYFNNPEFSVIPELLEINIDQPSSTAGYSRFMEDQSVTETAAFLKQNREIFDIILSKSKVDAEVIAAIMQVESGLGSYKGDYPLLNVFASLTLLNTDQLESEAPDFWDKILSDYPQNEHDNIKSKVMKKAKRKTEWAYRQLKTLLKLAVQTEGKFDPLRIKGSWAGAFGIPQFLPTSFENYGVDGDADGIINLCELDDSIASIANYLEKHGYQQDITKNRRKAVWHYNHSYEYVDCVITLADRVKMKLN